MLPRKSKRIVIDASVLRAAGESEHEQSTSCRRILECIRDVCHQTVSVPALENEAAKHRSKWAKRWLRSMNGRRKVSDLGSSVLSIDLDAKIIGLTWANESQQVQMQKDVHLVVAALQADGIVVSADAKARELFRMASKTIALLRKIHWIEPAAAGAIEWIEQGAERDPRWQLDPTTSRAP